MPVKSESNYTFFNHIIMQASLKAVFYSKLLEIFKQKFLVLTEI